MSTSSVPRSLTQMLRDRDDSELVTLLLERPDLAFPPPTALSDVASRATTRQSVSDAMSALNAVELWVATRAVAMSAPFEVHDLDDGRLDPAVLTAGLRHLVDLGLVWGDASTLSALRPVRAMAAMLDDVEPGPAPPPEPPSPTFETRSLDLVDKVAAGSAFELVRRMDVVLEHCDHRPPLLRRDGRLSTREVRAFAGLLDVPAPTMTTLFELATVAGLLGAGSDGSHEVLMPTRSFDDWQGLGLAEQWAVVVEAWMGRHHDSGEPWLKQLVLSAFGPPDAGHAVDVDGVRRWVAWHRPRRPARTDRLVATMLEQAAWLGVTGLGAVATFVPDVDVKSLDALLPARVDHVLVQADLTAVAPGPLTPDAAYDLGLLADVESRGGATVYRISPESLIRAHRLGWSAEEILATLQKRSTTSLPQALEYLVADLERPDRTGERSSAGRVAHHEPQRGAAFGFDELTAADRLDEQTAADLVARLREAVDVSRIGAPADEAQRVSTMESRFDSPVAALREAVESGEVVWVGYVDPLGERGERLIRAELLDDGMLHARDARTDQRVAVAVHRITAAHIIRT